eukprot:3434718-Ditylum_brightwellii.AAC.1
MALQCEWPIYMETSSLMLYVRQTQGFCQYYQSLENPYGFTQGVAVDWTPMDEVIPVALCSC